MCNHEKIRKALKGITVSTRSIEKYCTECEKFVKIKLTKEGAIII